MHRVCKPGGFTAPHPLGHSVTAAVLRDIIKRTTVAEVRYIMQVHITSTDNDIFGGTFM